MSDDHIREMQARVEAACAERQPLHICGGGSKQFLSPAAHGEALPTTGLQGIVDYEPTELVVTVRAGTRLSELQRELTAAGQMLGFEPPAFGAAATVGGTMACGLSGPRRPFAGALRDFVLGVRCLNGRGEDLHFGGQVMKNVAGYDVARLMAGARGTLGVLLEISFKVLPLPEQERTFCRPMPVPAAIQTMNELAARPLPLSAAAWCNGTLYIRFSGAAAAVDAAGRESRLESVGETDFWSKLREQQLDFFRDDVPVWRLSLPSTADQPDIEGDWIIDWGGAQRWLRSRAPAETIHEQARRAGGYAVLYRGPRQGQQVLPLLPEPLLELQQRLRQAFDPAGILNPGLLYTSC